MIAKEIPFKNAKLEPYILR